MTTPCAFFWLRQAGRAAAATTVRSSHCAGARRTVETEQNGPLIGAAVSTSPRPCLPQHAVELGRGGLLPPA